MTMRPRLGSILRIVLTASIAAPTTTIASGVFEEVAAPAGLEFVHVNGMNGSHHMYEHMGPGVGLFDYDADGDLDLYVVQGNPSGSGQGSAHRDRLYRNDLTTDADGTTRLRFTDVTEASAIDVRGYGMGVATGDYDGDGRTDLYVANLGANVMLRNLGDGTFADVTLSTGTGDAGWSTCATFFDYDRDGRLDLFVCNYLDYDVAENPECRNASGARDYCAPRQFRSLPDRLFRNRGDGTFDDVSKRSGIANQHGPALGVVAADLDGDGWVDLFVANDGTQNQLWINRRDGTFRNTGLMAGVALDADGKPESSMGVDAGDYDNDGDEDLYVTHLTGETNTLYRNLGSGVFEDATIRAGLNGPSLPFTGFGTAWIDYDNDGRLDLIAVNGAVYAIPKLVSEGDPFPLHQTNLLLRNRGDGRFENATGRAGPAFRSSTVSRGAAVGDIDNDGDADVVVGNNNGPLHLLLNRVGNRSHWLGLRLLGKNGGDVPGARVDVIREDGSTVRRRARSDGSYASANDPRVLVGLGELPNVRVVCVTWPDGAVEEWKKVAIDRWQTLRRGSGTRRHEGGNPALER